MDVFACWDGDHIGRQVGMAVLTDDVSEVRRVDQAIQQGNELWRSFALRVGGSVIEIGGDEGRIQFGADHLHELPDVARQYSEVVGATVSVGVGLKLSESAKALLVAKLHGGNQVLLWDPDMQAEIDAAQAKPQNEKDKLAEEYLGKGDTPGQTGTSAKDEHAGMTGSSKGSKVKGTQGDHDESGAAVKAISDAHDAASSATPMEPEGTHAAQDFESMLHDQAAMQGQEDQQGKVDESTRVEQIKKQVAQTLLQIRAQMPMIQQIQQASPETYQAIMNLVQGVIALGREVMTQAEVPADDEPSHVQEAVRKAEDNDSCEKCGSTRGANIDCESCLKKTAESAPPFVPEAEFDPAKAGEEGYLGNYVQPAWKERVSMIEPKTDFDDYDWKYHPDFETKDLGANSDYRTYLNDERREQHDDYDHPAGSDPYAHFGDWLKNPQRQPVVLFHAQDGIQPADGSHRLGYAQEKGVNKIPAIIGTPRKGLKKGLDDISHGQRGLVAPGNFTFDYSHHLPESERAKGLTMKVTHVSRGGSREHLLAEINHGKTRVGQVTGYIGDNTVEPHSELDPDYQKRGLGTAMYEAVYAHARNKLGLGVAAGGKHTEQAHRLHQRLSAQHGFEYQAGIDKTPRRQGEPKMYAPYSYALKDEMEASEKDDDIIGPGHGVNFVKNSSGPIPGEKVRLNLPPGSTVNGKVKVSHADGSQGWKGVRSGQIQGQEADAPIVGPNSHPVSSREPGSK